MTQVRPIIDKSNYAYITFVEHQEFSIGQFISISSQQFEQIQKLSVNKAIKLVKMGNVKAAAKAIRPAINYLIKMKCKKIILGCTELPIAIFAFKSFENVKSSKIFLDPNLILAHSAMVKHKN